MRTIKRVSRVLNTDKLEVVKDLSLSYALEKQSWLEKFQHRDYRDFIAQPRKIRDLSVKNKYASVYGLQSRMWKLALNDAAETMDKYYQGLFEKIKPMIYRNNKLSEQEKHYCFWLMTDYRRLNCILDGTPLEFNTLPLKSRLHAHNFLQRKLKRNCKHYPQVRLQQSFSLDADCYRIFDDNGRQYISLMTKIRGKRLAIPLTGVSAISGNLRVVVTRTGVVIHSSVKIKAKTNLSEDVIAMDLGYTEAFVASDGVSYGEGFGRNQSQISDWLKPKMQRRNKLSALAKKYATSNNPTIRAKAKNIKIHNLGKIKLTAKVMRNKSTSLRIINTALNQLIRQTRPGVLISEDLKHNFSYNNSKDCNRKLSAWLKGVLDERIEFKALAEGFSHKVVNAAYTSQTCPNCCYVDQHNRCKHNVDKFKCLNCGHEGHADVFAAQNLKARYFDHEITRYMPYREVKTILLSRFCSGVPNAYSCPPFGNWATGHC